MNLLNEVIAIKSLYLFFSGISSKDIEMLSQKSEEFSSLWKELEDSKDGVEYHGIIKASFEEIFRMYVERFSSDLQQIVLSYAKEKELQTIPTCPYCLSKATGWDGINEEYECFTCEKTWSEIIIKDAD